MPNIPLWYQLKLFFRRNRSFSPNQGGTMKQGNADHQIVGTPATPESDVQAKPSDSIVGVAQEAPKKARSFPPTLGLKKAIDRLRGKARRTPLGPVVK
jgi:hypothetical protein